MVKYVLLGAVAAALLTSGVPPRMAGAQTVVARSVVSVPYRWKSVQMVGGGSSTE